MAVISMGVIHCLTGLPWCAPQLLTAKPVMQWLLIPGISEIKLCRIQNSDYEDSKLHVPVRFHNLTEVPTTRVVLRSSH